MHNDIECPYCDAEQEIEHDDGIGYEEDTAHTQECGECGKTFVYYTSVSFYYKPYKAPCQNGEDHDWKVNTGHPGGYLSNFHTCSYCDKREMVNSDLKYNHIEDTWG